MGVKRIDNRDFFVEYDLIIVSPGGSAQTFIMNWIENKKPHDYMINETSDSDNLKHLSSFENSVFNGNKVKRVLYVFNNTLLSILSNFRRNWYNMQYRKISKYEDYNSIYLFDNQTQLFDQVMKSNQDISNVSAHFYNWLKYTGKIYFLDVNNIDEVQLSKFVGFDIDKPNISNRVRHEYTDVPEDIKQFYKNIDETIRYQINLKNKLD